MLDLAAMEDGHDLAPFDVNGDGLHSCPCFTIAQPEVYVDGKCWRVSHEHAEQDPDDAGCCVHVWGTPEQGDRIKVLLDKMDWYGDWVLVMEPGPRPDYRTTL